MTFTRPKGSLNICGPKVRYYRNLRNLSQAKLAEQCQLAGWDITRETIALIEGQRRWVGDFELAKLSKVLQASSEKLLQNEELTEKRFSVTMAVKMKNKAASELGKMAKGKRKKFSPKQIARLKKNLEAARKKRWPQK